MTNQDINLLRSKPFELHILQDLLSNKAYAEVKAATVTEESPKFDESLRFLLNGAPKRDRNRYRDLRKQMKFRRRQLRVNLALRHKHHIEISQMRWLLAGHQLHQLVRGLQDGWRARYVRHLSSAKWTTFRRKIVAERGARCEECKQSGDNVVLHVHQLTYENMGRELPIDVQLLCDVCHSRKHKRRA